MSKAEELILVVTYDGENLNVATNPNRAEAEYIGAIALAIDSIIRRGIDPNKLKVVIDYALSNKSVFKSKEEKDVSLPHFIGTSSKKGTVK